MWRLFVRDDSMFDIGSIAGGWCLTITTHAPGGGSTSCPATLAIAKAGQGQVSSAPAGINCGGTCAATFDAGSLVTLTATPAAGFLFDGWSGGGCSGTAECVVLVSGDLMVSAPFLEAPPETFVLTVTKAGAAFGTVTSTPPGIDCGREPPRATGLMEEVLKRRTRGRRPPQRRGTFA